MTHEEILTTLGNYVDYLIAGSSAEAHCGTLKRCAAASPINGTMWTAA